MKFIVYKIKILRGLLDRLCCIGKVYMCFYLVDILYVCLILF